MIASNGILDWPLASDPHDPRRFTQIPGNVTAPGRSALTRFVVLQRGRLFSTFSHSLPLPRTCLIIIYLLCY
jgi:hypothetical protein